MIKAYNLLMLLIGLSLFGFSGTLVGQQAVAPGGMAPVAQHLKDLDLSFSYIASDDGVVLVTIFTEKAYTNPATVCETLTKIGHVTKVTLYLETTAPEPSVVSAVCTDVEHQ